MRALSVASVVLIVAVAVALDAGPSAAVPAPQRQAAALTIYSSMPVHGPSRGDGRAIENGARLALEDASGSAGGRRIRYVRLASSLRSTGAADERQAARNARSAAADGSVIGYIGEYNSGISKVTIPILNKARIAQVSPTNTYVGLTERAPGSTSGEPSKYYPTGTRTYARLMPNDTVQGAALAAAARDAGCKALHIWDTRTVYSRGLAKVAAATARRLGLKVEARRSINPRASNYRRLARRIKSDCFVFTGEIVLNGVRAVRDAARARSVRSLFAGDAMCLGETAGRRRGLPRGVARRFRCTISSLAPSEYPPSSERVFEAYAQRFGGRTHVGALYGYESMALLLDAINRASAGGAAVTRRAVAAQLFLTQNRDSVLGTYSIDPNGDTTLTDFGLYGIEPGSVVFDGVVDGSP